MSCWVLRVVMWGREIRGVSLWWKTSWWDVISLRLRGHHWLAILVSAVILVIWSAHIAALVEPGVAVIWVGIYGPLDAPRPKPLP